MRTPTRVSPTCHSSTRSRDHNTRHWQTVISDLLSLIIIIGLSNNTSSILHFHFLSSHTWWHAMNVLKYVSSYLFASSECPVLSSIIWTVVNIDSLPTYCHISDYCLPLVNMFTNNINTYHQPLSLSCSSSPVKFYTPSSTGQTRELSRIIHFYR